MPLRGYPIRMAERRSRRSVPHSLSLLIVCALLAIPALGNCVVAQADGVWVLVDTEQLTLSVMEGASVKRLYRNIAIGTNGSTLNKREGDGRTPLGDFRVTHVLTNSRFRLFFGLGYPNRDHARRAFQEGLLGSGEYLAVRRALRANVLPPQNTPLGGFIGIHGIGIGDPQIHASFNWTEGCIALTNEQIDDLAKWVHVGTPVTIR
jgi:murein L,D-transpeptidase YafK